MASTQSRTAPSLTSGTDVKGGAVRVAATAPARSRCCCGDSSLYPRRWSVLNVTVSSTSTRCGARPNMSAMRRLPPGDAPPRQTRHHTCRHDMARVNRDGARIRQRCIMVLPSQRTQRRVQTLPLTEPGLTPRLLSRSVGPHNVRTELTPGAETSSNAIMRTGGCVGTGVDVDAAFAGSVGRPRLRLYVAHSRYGASSF